MAEREHRRVMATGTFDILHPGHIFYLEEAKSWGDELIVILARDSLSNPIVPEEQRLKVISSLKPVDKAELGSEESMMDPVAKFKPDLIALGPDQDWRGNEISKKLRERGLDVEVKRVNKYKECELCSTSKIIEKIKDL
ncbi:MAG: Cytidylyltransferase fused to conserved domain of DUF357 family [Candidatus Methanohalarchaeum thermophilum]|uniref:Cytidylyltransferase fused to conserved domain of DUF357 family n=1 Tax=Methanohalarchaeum thermophilum TaxID=1903181 RepID=A0A1Q6DUT6_METT1|nr:MAG: Cytidylyltransferase fused to conserved domain of DUF357 family [Candidatus Methanohalarchaeum thermophilum]